MGKSSTQFKVFLIGAVASYWAWLFYMFFVIAMQPSQSVFHVPIERASNMGGETVLLALFFLGAIKLGPLDRILRSRAALVVAGIATLAIAVEGILQLLFHIEAPLASHVACGLLSGAGQGIIFARIFDCLTALNSKQQGQVLVMGVSLAGLFAGILCLTARGIGVSCIAAFPVLAVLFLVIAERVPQSKRLAKEDAKDDPLPLSPDLFRQQFVAVVCPMVIFGVLFGVGSMVALASGVNSNLSFFLFLPFFLQGILFLALRLPARYHKNFSAISSWLMVAAAIALVLIPLASPDVRVFALAALILICQLFFLAALIRLLEICSGTPHRRKWLLLGLASDTLGKALGWGFGLIVILPDELNESFLIYLIIILVSALIIWETYIQNREVARARTAQENLQNAAESGSARGEAWQDKVARVGKRHNLSAREIEVLIELAKGKTAKFIGETLFISEGTVKSHTYRIYQKLGIHSQQELLVLLENEQDD